MWHSHRRRLWFAALPIISLVAAACGGGASVGSSGSDSLSMQISSPEEGAEVSSPFTVTFDANVPLDDPSTGEHHVHLGIDGADVDVESEYSLAYGETFELDLSPGEHTIEASLRNADHTDAGLASDEITVTVGSGGAGTGGGTDPGGDDDGGFGY